MMSRSIAMPQVAYCEEEVECRRVLLLLHFGEHDFSSSACRGTCDLCSRNQGKSFERRDMTEAAQNAVKAIPVAHHHCLCNTLAAICSLTFLYRPSV